MNRHKWWGTVFIFVFTGTALFGADEHPDFFQSIGKIYVVVTVISLVFLGLAVYLYRLDRRITELEKRGKNG